jgi:hypothetical protein
MSDRVGRAVRRLWGSIDKNGDLHGSPRFAAELAAQCNGKLALCVPAVSKWSYGQQLEHLYRASLWTLDRLEESLAGRDPSARMGLLGYGLMTTGFIPRGYFPTIPPLEPGAGTMAEIQPLQETLHGRLTDLHLNLKEIKKCRGKSKHPRMKYMTASQWLFFGDIHHRHHLAIMRDIANAAR